MMIGQTGVSPQLPMVQAFGASGDNERAEKIPDNEMAEMKPKAPLASYQGTTLDVQA